MIGICRAHAQRVKRPFGRCLHVSERLVRALRRKGIQAGVLRCSKGQLEAPEADPRWLRLRGGSSSWVHYVVQVDERYVDLTRRQYFPRAPHPYIASMTELVAQWRSIEPLADEPSKGTKQ